MWIKYGWRTLASICAAMVLAFTMMTGVAALASHESTSVRTFPAAEVQLLTMVAPNGNIMVSGGPTDTIRIETTVTTSLIDFHPEMELTNGVLSLNSQCFNGFPVLGCDVDYNILVPPTLNIRLATSAGLLNVVGMRGDVDIDSSRSAITLTDIAGRVQLEASQSKVVGTGFASPELLVDVSFTDLNISFVTAPNRVKLDASMSHTTVGVPQVEGGYRVTSESTLGDVEIHIPNNPSSTRSIELIAQHAVTRVLYAG